MNAKNLNISIAIATHNGQTYLEEQFQSLFTQTRKPDNVVVYDDASSDNTLAVLKELQAQAPFALDINYGMSNLRVNGAFSMALRKCEGDIVFFCDQDDIWEIDKIERFMEVFENKPEVGMVFSDASQIDGRGSPLGASLWESVGFTNRRQAHFSHNGLCEMLRSGNFIYGMASAFRTQRIRHFCPVLADPQGMTHDTWFALHTLATGWGSVLLKDQLVRYRRHDDQATKKGRPGRTANTEDRREIRRSQVIALIDSLGLVRSGVAGALDVGSEDIRSKSLKQLDDKLLHLLLRENLRAERSPQLAFQAIMSSGYWKYAKGAGSVLCDFYGF